MAEKPLEYGTVMDDIQYRQLNQKNLAWERLGPYYKTIRREFERLLVQKTQMRQRVAGTDALFDKLIELLGVERKWIETKGQKPRDYLQAEVVAKVEHLLLLEQTRIKAHSDSQSSPQNTAAHQPEHQYQ